MINIKSLLGLAVVTIIAVSCARIFTKNVNKPLAIDTWANMGVEEFQTLIADRCVDDAIKLSHPPSSPSPPAFNLSQHQVSPAPLRPLV